MSILENLLAAIEANTAAVNALVAAQGGAAAPAAAAAADKPAAGKKATAPAKKEAAAAAAPKHSVEEVKAAAVAVKEKFGSPAAKELIKEFGKADELKNIKPENYDAFVEACTKKVEGGDDETASEDDL